MEQTLDLTPFTMALREAFPEQVAFCGIQGSYGRGEAGPDSDVDLVVILEEAGARELERYRALIASMPFAGRACGFVCARRALAVWPKFDALQLLLDTKPLYGELSPLLPPMGPEDIALASAAAASMVYHAACHAFLFQGPAEDWLPALSKAVFFALRLERYRRTGTYLPRRQTLREALSPAERALLEPVGPPAGYCAALMDWAQKVMEDAGKP